MEKTLFGRRVIYTDVSEITEGNVLAVLSRAMDIHRQNRAEINYLYEYYKGKQPILNRIKNVRPEINNTVVENRANEIVSFKEGYLMGEPLQYVNRSADKNASEGINLLNEFMFSEDKASNDKLLANWFYICGTSYRMILPDPVGEEDESPFEIYTLDPRESFVVYHNGLGNKPIMGVKYITRENHTRVYSVYTDNRYFEIEESKIKINKPHALGQVPIIEYPANTARLGAFEIVLPILDAMNKITSNRLDGVEQFIQSILVLKGVDMDSEQYDELKLRGGIKVPADGDVSYLVQELNQTSTQTLVDYMYQTVLTVCGMPNRNGGSSTSDTGAAVIMRDGWSAAEARAKDTELMFKMSERVFLKLALKISNQFRNLNLKMSDIEMRFTRRNYENIQEKAQVLTTLLANDKIHPQLAFEHCGLFIDSEMAYSKSVEYYDEQEAKIEKSLDLFSRMEVDEDVQKRRQDDELSE